MERFDTNKDMKISWDEFVKALSAIRGMLLEIKCVDEVNSKASKSTHYKSYGKYFDDRVKHRHVTQ